LWEFPLDNIPTLSYDDKKKELLRMNVISLTVDSKKRISLTKLLPPGNIRSVQAYTEGHRIVLEPMMEVPVEEAWLFKNKDALKRVLTGLSQKGSVKRGSFARRAK
jgi:ribosome biogenesis protein Tsr3